MQETFRVAQQDDELQLRRWREANKTHAEKMKRLVEAADKSSDAALDLEEFRAIFNNAELTGWLTSMDFTPRDIDAVFEMMDGGEGHLTIDKMIKGVGDLKGPARNIDLRNLLD